MKVLVSHSNLTLCNPMNFSPPGFAIHGILLSRIRNWLSISFSKVLNLGLLHCKWILYCQPPGKQGQPAYLKKNETENNIYTLYKSLPIYSQSELWNFSLEIFLLCLLVLQPSRLCRQSISYLNQFLVIDLSLYMCVCICMCAFLLLLNIAMIDTYII